MAGMEQGLAAPRARLTAQAKAAQRTRIFERLREGWSYDEIARQERLTARRVRQIVAEVLRKPKVDGAARVRLLLEGPGADAARSVRGGPPGRRQDDRGAHEPARPALAPPAGGQDLGDACAPNAGR
jgi:hypothetical protein